MTSERRLELEVKPSPTELGESKKWWQQQLDIYSQPQPIPEPEGIFGSKLIKPGTSLWDNMFTRAIHPLLGVIGSVRHITSGQPLIGSLQTEFPEQIETRYKQEVATSFDNSLRAKFFVDMYSNLPILVSSGRVNTYEDYLNITGESGTYLTQDDIADARVAISSMTREREEVPDWLDIDEGDVEAVRSFLEQPSQRVAPNTIQKATIDAIVRSLSRPIAKLPEDMTADKVLSIASLSGLPSESVNQALDIDEMVRLIRDATLEKEQMIADVKNGLADWKIPDQTFWEKVYFTVQSPMQQFAEFMKPYIANVTNPMTGMITQGIAKAIFWREWEIEKTFKEKRAAGINVWQAFGESWEEYDLPMWLKLVMEIAFDPITYIPGWGLSKTGMVLTKVGTGLPKLAKIASFGDKLISFNKGIYSALDLPFDIVKWNLRRMPTTTKQLAQRQSDELINHFYAAAYRQTGKIAEKLSVADAIKTLTDARAAHLANPQLDGDVLVELGRMLTKQAPMTEKEIGIWSRSHGGRLLSDLGGEGITSPIVSEVNQIIYDFMNKVGSQSSNAKRMARALNIDETPENITKLIKEIPSFNKKKGIDIDIVTGIGKNAQIEPVARMLHYMVGKRKRVVELTETGKQASGSFLEGMTLSLIRKVDKIESWRWRQTLDRFFVKTLAEANLGSISYPIWNAFEGIAVSLIEGVVPRLSKFEAFTRMTAGLLNDPALTGKTASDIAGMFGSISGRRAGAITLLPSKKIPKKLAGWDIPSWLAGKDPLAWTGRRWVEMSDYLGNAYRRNFVMEKMSHYLAERALNVSGMDINLAFKNLTRGAPKLSRNSLGLTKHELEQEMFRRLTVSVDEVLGLKGVLTDGSLLQGEILKILRKADYISPRARAIGEQLIHEGLPLKNDDTILDFVKQVSQAAVDDLRQYPIEVGRSFRELSDMINTTPINKRSELMEIFTYYETMSETAAFIPHRLMSQAMEEADLLYNAKKFGQIDIMWRKARQDLMDTMADINASLESVRAKLLDNSGKLTAKQRAAMKAVLERSSASNAIRDATLAQDGQLLDDFFSLPKALRTPEEYAALRNYRNEIWTNYQNESAIPSAGEFVTRANLSKLYHGLPEPKLNPVNAEARALSIQDVADVFGVNIDGLSSGLLDNISLHGKPYFIQLVKQTADSRPNLFKGFTEEKIGQVYDDILRSARMNPEMDIAAQKILQQAEGMKHELVGLKMRHALSPDDERALHAWIDKCAEGRRELIGEGKAVSDIDWLQLRQLSLDDALKDYYKAFADYTNQNIIGATMKMLYPYWGYQAYRWFYLSRTALRHPGLPAAWGKYQDYGENGYQPTFLPNIEMNPFVGSVLGTTFTLTRNDFSYYYQSLGYVGEMFDYSQRVGFYPGAHVALPIALTSYFTGRPIEFSEILPPGGRTLLNVLVSSKVPGAVSLKEKVFHENFHQYYTATLVSTKQIKAGGTLIDGQSGTDLWFKILRGDDLSSDEQSLWDEAYREASLIGILRAQFPQFRLKTEEYSKAYDTVTQIIEEELGMTEEFQKDLWRRHIRPTDVVGGLPLDTRMVLDQLWQWKIYFGRGAILMPPEVGDLKALIDKYHKKVKSFQDDRLFTQGNIDNGFISPSSEFHYTGKEWRQEYASNWSDYASKVDKTKLDPEFADALEALTPEGQLAMAKRLGYTVSPVYPLDEAINLYFEIELEKKTDPYTGEEEDDFLTFWLKREAVRMALTEDQRRQFDQYIKRYTTPMEGTFRYAYNKYIRGYKAVDRIIFEGYSDEQKALIKEYYATTTTLTRREEIKSVISDTGRQLISEYDSKRSNAKEALREVSPTLDFYLYAFGYVTTLKTPEARTMVDSWESDRSSIIIPGVEGISYEPRPEE